MLSILIPVYNFDIRPLVNTLQAQCTQAAIPFEILCYDDVSDESYRKNNRSLGQLPGVEYREMAENKGRSKIRNLLGEAARFDYLLFMDCDSQVVRNDYIKKYLQHLAADTVLCGGRVYSQRPPKTLDHYFHWYYGIRREQRQASERAQNPYNAFLTHHFVIAKSVFLSIRFEEKHPRIWSRGYAFWPGIEKKRFKSPPPR